MGASFWHPDTDIGVNNMASGRMWNVTGWRALGRVSRIAMVFGLALTVATEAAAQSQSDTGSLVIGNDRGGSIRDRLIRIRDLRMTGQAVRIEGDICYSSCTLLIGLPQTCVAPGTTFGFHGPSYSGRPMSNADFEHTSQVMASYYPPSIRSWFLQEARYDIRSVQRVSGAELIRHGVKACG